MSAYYNEFEPYAAEWLRNLIKAGHIADGEVDERSIADVRPEELRDFTQCHFFAGIGGWSYAARLAGWEDTRPLWTGSCPCQPYSVAGKGEGQKDDRDLWPVWFKLIAAVRPSVVMGEQVAAAIGKHWLDRVRVDLEGKGYAIGAAVLPACAVGAPHRRDRLWFVADASRQRDDGAGQAGQAGRNEFTNGGYDVADADGERWQSGEFATEAPRHRDPAVANGSHAADADELGASEKRQQRSGQFGGAGGDQEDRNVGNANGELCQRNTRELFEAEKGERRANGAVNGHSGVRPKYASERDNDVADADGQRSETGLSTPPARQAGQSEVAYNGRLGPWGECEWLIGADGKARRVEPSIRLLAHGVPARVGKLRAFGNAIVPQVAAQVIAAYVESCERRSTT